VGCDAVVLGKASETQLCSATSIGLFKELMTCACSTICAKVCVNNFCNSVVSASSDCVACLKDTSLGCGFEFINCLND
jgi:hypothetical protein